MINFNRKIVNNNVKQKKSKGRAIPTNNNNNNNNNLNLISNSILYFNVLTQQLQEPITESPQIIIIITGTPTYLSRYVNMKI
jgi:hypothetical protein